MRETPKGAPPGKSSEHRLQNVSKTAVDSRGLEGATDSAENRALATEVARHRDFLKVMDAGPIPAASTSLLHTGDPNEDRR